MRVSRLSRTTVVSVVGALAIAVMMPRLLSAEFGLLDDGITIHVSRLFGASLAEGHLGFLFQVEVERGRFRPVYWLYGAAQYALWGPNAVGFFLTNSLTLALTALLLSSAVAFATKDALASLVTGVAYVLSPPVVESYYTLSKPEVPLALWLAASLCGWAGARSASERDPARCRALFTMSAAALLLAYLTKETAQVSLLVSAGWVIAQRLMSGEAPRPGAARVDRWYLGVNLLGVALFWIARGISGTATIAAGDDSQHYALTGDAIVANSLAHIAWYLRDFPALLPLLFFRWWRGGDRPEERWALLLPVVWIVAWTLIMLPWRSALEYYLLPASLGVSIIAGTGLASALRSLRAPARRVRVAAGALLAFTAVCLPLTLGNAITNGRVQLAVDAANARLVRFLAATAPPASTVLVNIPEPNEYLDELIMHLGVLKGRGDIKVEYSTDRVLRHDEAALIVSPVIANQPSPSVRVAVFETGAKRWGDDLRAHFGSRIRLVYRGVERVQVLGTQIHRPMCPVLLTVRAHDRLLCAPGQPLFDARRFEYGWEVYRARAS